MTGRYLNYLSYVLRHKWYVGVECMKRGLVLRALLHDWDKFLPSMFVSYARFFYEPDGTSRVQRTKTGYYKPTDTGDRAFDLAWLGHVRRSPHHWQYWVLPDEDGDAVFPMDEADLLEMICDWKGAGRAQGTPDTRAWWEQNNQRMSISVAGRRRIMKELGIERDHVSGPDSWPIPDYADVMTMDEFIENVETGGFIDYDGHGYYATKTNHTSKVVVPSDVTCGRIDLRYSHVAWFNR
jgi:hypothetical protein